MTVKRRWSRPTTGQFGMLAVAALFTPSRIWAANHVEIGSPDGLLIWSTLMLLLALAVWSMLVRAGGEGRGITYSVFLGMLLIGAGGPLTDDAPIGVWAAWLIVVFLGGLAYRLHELTPFRYLMSWMALFAFLMPLGIALSDALEPSSPKVESPEELAISSFVQTPDVVIVVFDGHASLSELETRYGVDAEARRLALAQAGLVVSANMTSNYTLTHLSLASFFEMDYPVLAGVKEGAAEWSRLLEIVRGDNQLVDIFKDQGYRLVTVESGWSGIQCERDTDICIRRGWPDDATSLAIHRSLFRDLQPGLVVDGFAKGSLESIRWLRKDVEDLVNNGERDLVFVHMMIPHPPFYVDDRCQYAPWLSSENSRAVGWPGISEDHLADRKTAYVAATRCAESVIVDLTALLRGRAVLIGLGDHGPDSLGQLFKDPSTWDAEDIGERLSVFFAVNTDRCALLESRSLVNVGRKLIGCLSGSQPSLLRDRFFVSSARRVFDGATRPVREVHPQAWSASGRDWVQR